MTVALFFFNFSNLFVRHRMSDNKIGKGVGHRAWVGWLLCCLVAGGVSAAETQNNPIKDYVEHNQVALNLGEDPGPAYKHAVYQWAQVTDFAKNAAEVAVAKIKAELLAEPRYKAIATSAFVADLEQFFYELFASNETISDLSKLYAQYFSIDEMQALAHFYETPLGRKLVKLNNELALKSQQIGMKLLQENEGKYMQIVQKYLHPTQEQTTSP